MKPLCLTELGPHILDVININEIPFVKGSPGIGKSAMYKWVAEQLNLEFIDFRLSMVDQTRLNGFPKFKDDRSFYAPPAIFPLEGDPLPEGKNGWLISFEEINSTVPSIQAMAYKILHDRMVGDYNLHPAVRLCANGNLETDGAVVMPLSTALASRMIQFHAVIKNDKWLEWAEKSDRYHPILLSYLTYRPEYIHRFNPKDKDPAYPCPRMHEKVSKLLWLIDKSEGRTYSSIRHSIEGAIGEAATQDFYAYLNFFKSVIPLKSIIANPHQNPPSDMGVRYATLINAINNLNDDEDAIVKVITHFEQRGGINNDGYSIEYPSLILKKIMRKHRKLIMSTHFEFNELIKKYKKYLVD